MSLQARAKHSCLLDRFSGVSSDGAYTLADPAVPFRFEHVAQRLLSGRICIAGGALSHIRDIANDVDAYGRTKRFLPIGRGEVSRREIHPRWQKDNDSFFRFKASLARKVCFVFRLLTCYFIFRHTSDTLSISIFIKFSNPLMQTVPLADLPCMRDALAQVRGVRTVFECYVQRLEKSFMTDKDISPQLVHRIACAKILSVEFVIDAIKALKERVGALSLQDKGPFGGQTDILYVFRFAEGDSAVLRQKMVRDLLGRAKSPSALVSRTLGLPVVWMKDCGSARTSLHLNVLKLVSRMAFVPKKAQTVRWLEEYELIERIANCYAQLTVLDDVAEVMRGTRELQHFRHYYGLV
jgi:hypothetical protein